MDSMRDIRYIYVFVTRKSNKHVSTNIWKERINILPSQTTFDYFRHNKFAPAYEQFNFFGFVPTFVTLYFIKINEIYVCVSYVLAMLRIFLILSFKPRCHLSHLIKVVHRPHKASSP